MIKIKKSDLEAVLLTIATYDPQTQKQIGGLLIESLSLGTKRKLQKIHQKAVDLYKEFVSDLKEIQETYKEDNDTKLKELNVLLAEEISIDVEPFDISQLDNVITSNNYSFEILEKIGK
jgi:hypothetical protein